jgi:hypothetical protein
VDQRIGHREFGFRLNLSFTSALADSNNDKVVKVDKISHFRIFDQVSALTSETSTLYQGWPSFIAQIKTMNSKKMIEMFFAQINKKRSI